MFYECCSHKAKAVNPQHFTGQGFQTSSSEVSGSHVTENLCVASKRHTAWQLPLLFLVLVVVSAVPAVGSRNIQPKMFAKLWHIEIMRSLFFHKVSLEQTES